MYNVELTGEQKIILNMYLHITTQHRRERRETYESVGSAENAKWWAEAEVTLQEVLVALEVAREVSK